MVGKKDGKRAAKMIMQVHGELVFEVPEAEVENGCAPKSRA